MPSTKARRPKRSKPRRQPAPQKRARSSARSAVRPPETLITDPHALLAAMAACERSQAESSLPPVAPVQTRPTPCLLAPPEPDPEPVVRERPVLREDERFARPADSGVIVIIRRRRAA